MLIAFTVDAELRLATPADSLDQAFSAFYQKYLGNDLGYTTDDVVSFFQQRHAGLGDMIARQATTASNLVVEKQLERLGLRSVPRVSHYLGLMFRDGSGATIYGVLDNSPAGESGIAPNDILTTVNSYPFSTKALTWAVQNSPRVTLTVQRGQRLLTFELTPREYSQVGALVWAGDDEQARRIRTWLLCDDFHPTTGQVFQLDFYENFHGVETIL